MTPPRFSPPPKAYATPLLPPLPALMTPASRHSASRHYAAFRHFSAAIERHVSSPLAITLPPVFALFHAISAAYFQPC
jgi:hypothetical protein